MVSLCVLVSVVIYDIALTENSSRDLYSASRRLNLESPADIFDEVAPSVVFINTFADMRTSYFSTEVTEVPLGAGSGFVWDSEGHIVTNYHVIAEAKEANVTISTLDNSETDGVGDTAYHYTRKQYIAKLIGVDPDKDVAVLKVDAANLSPISVGSLKGHRIGEPAYAIGHPFGLDHSMTAGIISAFAREIESPNGRPIQNVIQTDADINPGNSGGPLLDGNAKIIGMNTAGATTSSGGGSTGVGFAVPINDIKKSVEELIKNGKVVRAALGISTLDQARAMRLGIESGVLVLKVSPDSPAVEAGLRETRINPMGTILALGDIIIKINDDDVESDRDLYLALQKFQPGQEVKLVVERQVGELQHEVKVDKAELTTTLIEMGETETDMPKRM